MTRTYGGVSADVRRRERRERLIEAGFDLMGTEGVARMTVTAVCQRAGLTERYFYESFPDRAALLTAVAQQKVDELRNAMLRVIGTSQDPDVRAVSRQVIDAGIRLATGDPRVARILFKESLADETLGHLRTRSMAELAALVAAVGQALYGDQLAKRELDFTATVVVGGLFEAMLMWSDGVLKLTIDELIDEATELVIAIYERYTSD